MGHVFVVSNYFKGKNTFMQLNRFATLSTSIFTNILKFTLILLSTLILIITVLADGPGTLDTSFGNGGKIITDFGEGDIDTAYSVAIQDDGKVVVVGSTSMQFISGSSVFALARYNIDGSLDTSFDGDGKVIYTLGSLGGVGSAVAIQPDGKIVVAGTSWGDFALLRFNSDGSLDDSFGYSGWVMTTFGAGRVNDMAIQPDGKIIVIGRDIRSDFAIVRYNSDGSLDASFSDSGVVITDLGAYDTGYNLIIQPDGNILVAGTSDKGNMHSDFALVRYKNNGSLDRTFGVNGKVITDSNDWCESGYDIILQPDGKIVMVGEYPDVGTLLVRYHSTGSLDTSFGDGGKVFTAGVYGYHLVSQSDGKIIVGGNIWNRPGSDFGLIRYNNNGSLDTSFGINGIARTDFGQNDYSHGLAIQSDDKIVIVGESENKFAIARYIGINHPELKMVPQNIAQIQAYSDTNLIRRNLSVNNTGGEILTWSAVSSEPWIELGINSGTAPSTIPITITLPVTTSGGIESTSLGEYTGLITFTGEGIVFNNPQVVKVKINVVQQVYHGYLPIILR